MLKARGIGIGTSRVKKKPVYVKMSLLNLPLQHWEWGVGGGSCKGSNVQQALFSPSPVAATCCLSIEFVTVLEMVATPQASEQVYYPKNNTSRPTIQTCSFPSTCCPFKCVCNCFGNCCHAHVTLKNVLQSNTNVQTKRADIFNSFW